LSRALAIGVSPPAYHTESGLGTYLTQTLLGQVCQQIGEENEAIACFTRAAQLHPEPWPLVSRLLRLFKCAGRESDISGWLAAHLPGILAEERQSLVRVLVKDGCYAAAADVLGGARERIAVDAMERTAEERTAEEQERNAEQEFLSADSLVSLLQQVESTPAARLKYEDIAALLHHPAMARTEGTTAATESAASAVQAWISLADRVLAALPASSAYSPAAARGIVSEIIIADTGSSDGSMDIARRFGARVIELPWEHDFSKARNQTLRLASCAWILVLDADEAIADWRMEEVQPLLEAPGTDGYFLPFIHYVGEFSEGDYVTDNVCRLFRNDERILFHGSIHEEAASSIWSLPGGHIAYANLPVYHYGYLDGELQRKHKSSRNLELISSALNLEPHSVHLRYALGTEHYQQGNYIAAAELLLPLLEEVPAGTGYTADLYLKTAYALQAGGRIEEAQSVYEAGSILFADFTDLLESYAGLLLEQGELGRAYHLLQRALRSGDTAHKYPSSSGSGTSRTHLSAGRICERLFLYDEALDHYGQAVSFSPDYSAAWEQLAPLCLLSGQEERLTDITRQLLPGLSRRVLSRLVPAALNARAARWLAALCAAPHLPEAIRQVLQVLLGTLFRDPEQPFTASVRLERMLLEVPDQPWVSGYLWGLSCRSGGIAAAGRWLGRLAPHRPGLAAVHHWLAQQTGDDPASSAEREPEGDPLTAERSDSTGPLQLHLPEQHPDINTL
ncbi:hypothetical protein KC345_g11166, partial [Hortaea werneckii]